MKVLLPVDGSVYTQRVLDYISTHDQLFGPTSEYVVITALVPIPARAASFLSRSTVDEYYRDEAETVLQPVRAFLERKAWPFQASYAVGRPADIIAAQADAYTPDLIVMGSHGNSALGNVLLGSVATGVLAKSKTPVLLVR